MNRFAGILTAAVVGIFLVVPAGVSALPIGTTGVLVFLVDEPSASIHLGGGTTFAWIAYNNGTSPVLLVAKPPTAGGLTFTVSASQSVLQPAESAEFRLQVTAPRYGVAQSLTTSMTFEARELSTGSVASGSFSLRITILGVTGANDPQGKVLGLIPNPLPAPLDNEWGAFALTVGVWLLAGALVHYGIAPLLRGIARGMKGRLDRAILGIIRGPVVLLFVLFGAVNSLTILGLPPEWRGALGRAYAFLSALIFTWIAYRVFRNVLVAYGADIAKRSGTGLDDRLFPILDKLGAVVIVVLGIVTAVQGLGYDITLFLAGLGVIGLIVAFAAQDTLSNFFAGIHLMLDRPFRKGDLIQLETGEICEVLDVGVRSTKLYWGKGNVVLILSNNKIAGTKIVNFNRPDLPFKVHVTVGVAYGSDIERVKRVMLDIADGHPEALHGEGHPAVFQIDEFGESAVLVRLIFWVPGPREQWRVASDVRETILKRFRADGIEIPFPQRIVWTREEDRPLGGRGP